MNKQAFLWGRRAAHDILAVEKLVAPPAPVARLRQLSTSLAEIVEARVKLLTAYQDAAYAQRYSAMIDKVRAAEASRAPGTSGLAEAVARNYAKLLAYKDEYEVARMHADPAFARAIAAHFEGDYTIKFHLAPPLLADRDDKTGHLVKRQFGAWMLQAFRVLRHLKVLRGTKLDIFGWTAERRMERQLVIDYESTLEEILNKLSPANHGTALRLANLPDEIRGYGHVKEANVAKARKAWDTLLATFRDPAPIRQAAE
jgi:indolepyruvate ferredoxin oxidoreductase